ncbi:MAG: glutamate-cysteine ligase family protein [Cyanobacteria bacterium J06642_11]
MTSVIQLREEDLWLSSLEDVHAFYAQSLSGSGTNAQTYGFEVELYALQQQREYAGHLANAAQVECVLRDLQAADISATGAVYTLDLAQQLEFASAPRDSITALYRHGQEAEKLLQKTTEHHGLRLSALPVHPSANWSDLDYLNHIDQELISDERTELVIPNFQRCIDTAKQSYSAHDLLATCGIHTTFAIADKAALEETLTLVGAVTPLIAAANHASPFSHFDSTQNSAREILWDASLTRSNDRFGLPARLSGEVTLEDVVAHVINQPMWYGIDQHGRLHGLDSPFTFADLIRNGGLYINNNVFIAPTLEQYVNHSRTCYNSYRIKPTFTDNGIICLTEFRIPDGGSMSKAVMNVALIHGLTHGVEVRGQFREILERYGLLDAKGSKQAHYEHNKNLQQQLLRYGLHQAALPHRGIAAIKVWQEIVNLACRELLAKENTPEIYQVLRALQATTYASEANRHREALQRLDADPNQLSKPHYADKLDLVTGYAQFGERYELPPARVLYHQAGDGR